MAEGHLEFGLLGPLEMRVDGTLVPLGTPKQRAVLAMLLMNRNSPVGVERLITAVWEDEPPSGARASLHSYVSNLRKLLTGAGIDPRAVLVAAPPGISTVVLVRPGEELSGAVTCDTTVQLWAAAARASRSTCFSKVGMRCLPCMLATSAAALAVSIPTAVT